MSYVFPNNYAIALASLNNGRPLVLDNHTKLASALTLVREPARRLASGSIPHGRSPSGLLSMFGSKR